MKIISLHTSEEQLIKKAKKKNRKAQKAIYDKYSSKMLSVCRRYVNDLQFAEDVMIKGFFKAFKYIDSFQYLGSFEGWLRKIMVRESIDHLQRKKEKLEFVSDRIEQEGFAGEESELNFSEIDYVQFLLDELPDGYRMVFNMYVFEGYKHREIAEVLGISVGTSKSQLSKARKTMRVIVDKNKANYGQE